MTEKTIESTLSRPIGKVINSICSQTLQLLDVYYHIPFLESKHIAGEELGFHNVEFLPVV